MRFEVLKRLQIFEYLKGEDIMLNPKHFDHHLKNISLWNGFKKFLQIQFLIMILASFFIMVTEMSSPTVFLSCSISFSTS